MNKKKFSILMMLVLILIALSACSTNKNSINTTGSEKNIENKCHSYKDALDREVQIPNDPKRILALNSSLIETIFNIGVTPIAVVDEYMVSRSEAENLPSIALENSPNIEIINKLKPDLIIAQARNHAQFLESLEKTGATVVYIDPSSMSDQLIGPINEMGEILNRQDEAEVYIKKIESKSKEMQEKLKETPIKTALLIQGGTQNISAARSFCFWGRLLTYLGIKNIVPDDIEVSSKAGFISFDIETIMQKDPDAIFILQPGFRSGKGNKGENNKNGSNSENISSQDLKDMLINDPMWQNLSAVKNNRLIILPKNISPGRIEIIKALDVMTSLILSGEY